MMMLCLHRAGIPLAFTPRRERQGERAVFGNPEGFFEGKWNGGGGLVKVLNPANLLKFPEAKVIVMRRDPKEILKSWERVNSRRSAPMQPGISPERIAERFAEIEKAAEGMDHVTVDYARFTEDPETHREAILRLLPDLDWEKFRSGVDTNAGSRAARIRVREKGSGKEGHVFQGQRIVTPCKGCGG